MNSNTSATLRPAKTVYTGFYLPQHLLERIDRQAKANERTRSQELRHLLKAALQPTDQTPRQDEE